MVVGIVVVVQYGSSSPEKAGGRDCKSRPLKECLAVTTTCSVWPAPISENYLGSFTF